MINTVYLFVLSVSPKVVIPAPVVRDFQGYRLSCSATGTPPIYTAVIMNSTTLVNTTNTASVRVYEEGKSMYTCRATSKYGTHERHIELVLEGKP